MNLSDQGIIIAQPGRQHAHQLARALHGQGWLKRFYTLLPSMELFSKWPTVAKRLLPKAVERNGPLGIPKDLIRCRPLPLTIWKIFSRSQSSVCRLGGELYAWRSFDRWVAARLDKELPRVVVGYELSCVETFEKARRLGITCVLDAASFDFRFQDETLHGKRREAATSFGKELRQRKDKEIALADHILCVSNAARESYLAAGASPKMVDVNPVGCDTALFRPMALEEKRGPCKFVFVGTANIHKGFDLILEAFSIVSARYPEASLHVIGDENQARLLEGGSALSSVVFHGKLSHAQLAEVLASMDCLLLPSRLDSFGMVVVEALAAGVPVIVSENVGAKMAVEDGRNGWIVPVGSAAALASAMDHCVLNHDMVRAMSPACRSAAMEFDWKGYRNRSIALFQRLISEEAR